MKHLKYVLDKMLGQFSYIFATKTSVVFCLHDIMSVFILSPTLVRRKVTFRRYSVFCFTIHAPNPCSCIA